MLRVFIAVFFSGTRDYTAQGSEAFEEVFELAETGKPFQIYSRAQFKRAK